MEIKKIMTTPVISVEAGYTLEMIEKIMTKADIGHVTVRDEGKLVGIIADSDVKKFKSRLAGTEMSNRREEETLKLRAHQIMTRDPYTVNEKDDISIGMELLLEKKIHSLPVVNDKGSCTGILTVSDLLKFFKNILEKRNQPHS